VTHLTTLKFERKKAICSKKGHYYYEALVYYDNEAMIVTCAPLLLFVLANFCNFHDLKLNLLA
jgi:hypothetical protein